MRIFGFLIVNAESIIIFISIDAIEQARIAREIVEIRKPHRSKSLVICDSLLIYSFSAPKSPGASYRRLIARLLPPFVNASIAFCNTCC